MFELYLAGAVGGLFKSLAEPNGKVILPKFERTEKNTYVHLGFLSNIFLGALIGGSIGTDPISAITGGFSAGYITETSLEKTIK